MNIFAKRSTLDVWQGSKYAFVSINWVNSFLDNNCTVLKINIFTFIMQVLYSLHQFEVTKQKYLFLKILVPLSLLAFWYLLLILIIFLIKEVANNGCKHVRILAHFLQQVYLELFRNLLLYIVPVFLPFGCFTHFMALFFFYTPWKETSGMKWI